MKSKLSNLKFNKNSKFQIPNYRKGFTLIELLVVIAIIGILATFLMINFLGVQQRARDAQRKSDLRQIQSALELYRADQGTYPATLYSTDCPTSSSLRDPGGTVTYMTKIPCDPSSLRFWTLPAGDYSYGPSGSTYTLTACIENSNDTDPNTHVIGVAFCASKKSYLLTNP